MAIDRLVLIRAFVRAAKLQAGAASTPKAVLEQIILGKFTSEATHGKTLISTTEAGGTATFILPDSFGPAEVMALAEEAIEWLENQPDPNNPNLSPRRISRLRVSFDKSAI